MTSRAHTQHFPSDGYNGTYYAEFYTAVVERLKAKWPTVQYGGPVSGAPCSTRCKCCACVSFVLCLFVYCFLACPIPYVYEMCRKVLSNCQSMGWNEVLSHTNIYTARKLATGCEHRAYTTHHRLRQLSTNGCCILRMLSA